DGIAIIGFDADKATLLQHYFDSRGVARVYEMTFADNVWTLQRFAAAPDFSQRFTGTFNKAGDTISGMWEISRDGATWEHDYDLDRCLDIFSTTSQRQRLPAWNREDVRSPARLRLYHATASEHCLLSSTDERIPVVLASQRAGDPIRPHLKQAAS